MVPGVPTEVISEHIARISPVHCLVWPKNQRRKENVSNVMLFENIFLKMLGESINFLCFAFENAFFLEAELFNDRFFVH